MHVKHHHHHANDHILNYPIFSLKFIPSRLYIWKIEKTKSLSHVSIPLAYYFQMRKFYIVETLNI